LSRSSWIIGAATLAGLVLAICTLDFVGLGQTLGLLQGIGAGGLLLFLLAHLAVLLALGCAWASSGPGNRGRWLTFAWARAVREAANELLPFSQLGGLVVGLKVLADAGVGQTRAYAATVIDLTTEIASQLLLVLCGVAISVELVTTATANPELKLAIWVGTAVLALLCASFLLLRGPVLRLVGRLAGKLLPVAGAVIDDVRAELASFEAARWAFLPSFLWNALAWLLSVLTVWLGLRLLGHPLAASRVLALEALISVVRSGAFLIPGAVGVQEVGYVLLASVVGLDPHAALALSLLKRARDVGTGVPILLIWQGKLFRTRR
jgi:putative membrane protein